MNKQCAVRLLAPLCFVLLFAATSKRGISQVIGANIYVQNSGNVIATYQGNSAAYSNDLYLDSPTNALGIIFNNHASPIGSTVDLGTFAPGTELIFRLHVNNTGNDFFTGQASRNPDNSAHARVTNDWQPGETLVEFEDLFNGPFVYNDLSFSFTNTSTRQDVPEPGALAMLLGGGAAFLFSYGRYRRR